MSAAFAQGRKDNGAELKNFGEETLRIISAVLMSV